MQIAPTCGQAVCVRTWAEKNWREVDALAMHAARRSSDAQLPHRKIADDVGWPARARRTLRRCSCHCARLGSHPPRRWCAPRRRRGWRSTSVRRPLAKCDHIRHATVRVRTAPRCRGPHPAARPSVSGPGVGTETYTAPAMSHPKQDRRDVGSSRHGAETGW
jgi:hypothetical protein